MKTFLLFCNLCLFAGSAQSQNKQTLIQIDSLEDGFYQHISWITYKGVSYPSNGLLAQTNAGLLLIDTPTSPEATEQLLTWTQLNLQDTVRLAIVTHFHQDRLAGIDILKKHGIKVISTAETARLAKLDKVTAPNPEVISGKLCQLGKLSFEPYYAGQGHTSDNIVVWFEQKKLLYGGCLVKSTEAEHLGYTGDANLKAWPGSLKKLLKRYPTIEIVMPGHDKIGGKETIMHSLWLLKNNKLLGS